MNIINGDCLQVMKTYPHNHFSGIVTDPPYGIHFMGKDWDKFKKTAQSEETKHKFVKGRFKKRIGGMNTEAGGYDDSRNDEFEEFMYRFSIEALRICKPGAFILMCGAPRRFHRQVCGLEDAGWIIRDCISWLYGSGFPKSHNHFGIPGFGTALKPAWEPIIMAMKPCEGTFAQNAEKWSQAGINIEASRIGNESRINPPASNTDPKLWRMNQGGDSRACMGRWPSNLILDEIAGEILDAQSGTLKSGALKPYNSRSVGYEGGWGSHRDVNSASNSGGASRFFYCPKASSAERNRGCEELSDIVGKRTLDGGEMLTGSGNKRSDCMKNSHPTVKPIKLMEYLVRLIAPPKDAIILDPFAGSGTTLLACQNLGIACTGIEMNADYCEIAKARLFGNATLFTAPIDEPLHKVGGLT
jgi:DNA modification methylase